jgi:adenylate cyclase
MKNLRAFVDQKILTIGAHPQDSQEERLKKQMFVSLLFLVVPATILWGVMYALYREVAASLISFGYSLLTILSIIAISRWKRIDVFIPLQLINGLLLPFVHTILLGGFAASGVVIMWSLISPLAALFHYRARQAAAWFAAFVVLLAFAVLLEPLGRQANFLPAWLVRVFFVMNIGGVSGIVFLILNYFLRQRNEALRLLLIEQEKAENLLLNVLPKEIAEILKNEKRTIADNFEGASILFADLVGFTPLTAKMAPIEMVNLLNQIFSFFDELVEKYDVEKIRTIGDSYMVASGVPRPRPDHAHALAYMALEMRDHICSLPAVEGRQIQFRIGINSGPVVGGVIGRKKFVYDLWGDAVNIASRMESHGVAGKIQITQATYDLIRADFACEPRGTIAVKGRGEMGTWFLEGVREPTA